MPTSTANTFLQRLIGAAALDTAIYEEVEADQGASMQALGIVVLSSVAIGVGARGFGSHTVSTVAFFSMVALLAWAAWALVVFEIGSRLMPDTDTHTDVGELLRTIAFSATPGLLTVLAVLPGLASPVFVVVALWMLITMVVAVRQALDFHSTWRAIAVCGLGWVLALAIAVGLGVVFGPSVA